MKSLLAVTVCVVLTLPPAAATADPSDPPDGVIRVDVRGPLGTMFTGADDDGNPVFRHAAVQAGRQTLHIDPSESKQALAQLLYWSVPRHGDFRQLHVHVKGRLEFRDTRPRTGVQADDAGPWPYLVADDVRIAPLRRWEAKRFMAGDLELPAKP